MSQPGRAERLPFGRALGASALVGVALGATNSLSNAWGSPYSPFSWRPYEGVFALEVLAAVVGSAWAWAIVAFGIGWFSASGRRAVLMPVIALELAVLVYYLSDFVSGLNDELSTWEMAYWAGISLAVGPTFGLAGHLARCPRWWSILAALPVPVVIAVFITPGAGSDKIRPWPDVAAWIIFGVLSGGLIVRWAWWLRQNRLRRSPTREPSEAESVEAG